MSSPIKAVCNRACCCMSLLLSLLFEFDSTFGGETVKRWRKRDHGLYQKEGRRGRGEVPHREGARVAQERSGQ